MKTFGFKKVLGIALGERSLQVAEMSGGDRPDARRLVEFVYPEALSLANPQPLGVALAAFLHQNQITTRAAIVGIPARWIAVKSKEVPPTDSRTLISLLRLQAEAEFSSDLKDLIYDFTGDSAGDKASSVILMALPRKQLSAVEQLTRAAGLNLAAVTSSAVALGEMTGRALNRDVLVLAASSSGAELTQQIGSSLGAMRHLRSPAPAPAFVSELRRAITTLPVPASGREMILWGQPDETVKSLSEQMGFKIVAGALDTLGVNAESSQNNGESRRFAEAVAVGLTAMGDRAPRIDFLHSRLAPPKIRRIPRWSILAAAVAIALIVWGVYSYRDLVRQEQTLAVNEAQLTGMKKEVAAAEAFVTKVSFAQGWHGGDPRYLDCWRDFTSCMSDDGEIYATNLTMQDAQHPGSTQAPADKHVDSRTLSGQIQGKASDQQHAFALRDRMQKIPGFTFVQLGSTQDVGHGREFSFSISFIYQPASPKH